MTLKYVSKESFLAYGVITEYTAAGYPTSPRRPFFSPFPLRFIPGKWNTRIDTRNITSGKALFFSGLLRKDYLLWL